MKIENFYQAEALAEEHSFETLICAVFICCQELEKGEKLKEMFPDEWEFVMKSYIQKRIEKE